MRKVVIVLIFIIMGIGGYFGIQYFNEEETIVSLEKQLNIQNNPAYIQEYYVYGRYLNMKGYLENIGDMAGIKLILFQNGNKKSYDLKYQDTGEGISFYLSDFLNEGILLDEIEIGKYIILIEVETRTEGEEQYQYFLLQNNTEYPDLTYYSMNEYDKKVSLGTDSKMNTMYLEVVKNKDSGIYDIVLDPGHGGMDTGATQGKYRESKLTYELATLLQEKLEGYGFRVKLTHKGNIPLDEVMDNYGENGRAVIPQKAKAKYLFSLHFNSSTAATVKGLEIYTAKGIRYDFIRNLAKNLVQDVGLDYSRNVGSLVEDGIYTRNFTSKEREESRLENIRKNRSPYSISKNSNYYYMIRETGGFMTGAYVDDRNIDSVGENPYYNSNIGIEAYIMELGFITNKHDLNNFLEKKADYAESIAKSIYQELLGK